MKLFIALIFMTSCSWLAVRAPDRCRNYGAPIVDTTAAAASTVATALVVIAASNASEDTFDTLPRETMYLVAIPAIALAAVHTVSAIHGYRVVARCRRQS